jgi:drug/metabolite transporter (DMT)-like permease
MAVDGIPASARTRAYLLAFTSAATAGGSSVAAKVGIAGTATANYLAWMFAFAVLFSAGVRAFAGPDTLRPVSRRAVTLLVLHATLAGLGCACWYTALASMDVAVATFVGRTEVLVTVVLSLLLLGERLTRLETVGGAVALAGLVLMTLPLGRPAAAAHTTGILWILVGSLAFGAGEILAKPALRLMSPTTFALGRNVLLAAGWTVVALLTGVAEVPSWPVLLSAGAVALLGPVFARLLYLSAIRVIALSRAALVAQTMPLFAAVVGFLALGTSPQPHEWAGGLVLLLGTLLVVRGARPPELPVSPPEP